MSDILPAQVWSEARVARSIFQYIRYQHIGLFTAVLDFVLILAASVFAGVFYHQVVFDTEGELVAYLAVGCYAGFIFILLFKLLGLYQPNALLSAHRQLRGVLISWIAVVLFITSLFFVLKTGAHYSRGAIIGFSICGLIVIVGFRAIIGAALKQALANGTIAGRKVIILGDSEELAANSVSSSAPILWRQGGWPIRTFADTHAEHPIDQGYRRPGFQHRRRTDQSRRAGLARHTLGRPDSPGADLPALARIATFGAAAS